MNVFADTGVDGVIRDAYTDEPVSGASVTSGERQVSSNGDGTFEIDNDATELHIEKEGYDPTAFTITSSTEPVEVLIRPNVVQGTVTNEATGEPLADIVVTLQSAGGASEIDSTETDAQGAFLFVDVPEGAALVIDSPDHAPATIDLTRKTTVEVALRPDVIVGKVVDPGGTAMEGVRVIIGESETTSGSDGNFRLEGAPEAGNVIFKAPGYRAMSAPLDNTMTVNGTMEPITVKALYATAGTVGQADMFNGLIDIIDRTEANALVVDLKDSSGLVFYDTQVQLAKDIGAVSVVYDPKQVVDLLREKGIYSIARIVVFEDPIMAEARPEWAIKDSNGGLWRTWNGLAWVNAHRTEIWDYNIALAKEAAAMGFDEVQLDYMRFPSDGPLDQAEYGTVHDDTTRPAAIGEFLNRAQAALAPTPTYLAGDVFGLTLWELGDGGIGQHLETFAEPLDYICPMIYPSHFYPGSMGFDIPNNHPYEVILWSLENGLERIPQHKNKLRPWLQDFSYGQGIEYGANEVRLQINAANDFGATGWLLWNAANVYSADALAPQ